MADPSKVQDALIAGDASTSLSGNFGSLPTVGNYVVVLVASGSATNPASALVDDNQGHTYTKLQTVSTSNAGTVQIWYTKVATSSGTFTVNAKLMGSANVSFVPVELTNVHPSSPVLSSSSFDGSPGTFAAKLATGAIVASPQINAFMVHVISTSGTGQTYTSRGDLTTIRSQNTVVSGDVICASGGKLTAHGNIVGQIGLSAGDDYAAATAIFAGTDPAVTGPGGNGYDDRIRVERSGISGNGTGASWTMFRSRWVESTRDFGASDTLADDVSRSV